eukprot:6764670-Ditylum_brightwellii.AAC.1
MSASLSQTHPTTSDTSMPAALGQVASGHQMAFPKEIQGELITESNPHGRITVNNLKLSAIV